MDTSVSFTSNQKLEKQNMPKRMNRLSRKKPDSMLPKINFEIKQQVSDDLLSAQHTFPSNQSTSHSNPSTLLPNQIILPTTIFLDSDDDGTNLEESYLQRMRTSAKKCEMTETLPVTIPISYNPVALSNPIFKLNNSYTLTMTQIKTLEFDPPASIVRHLKTDDSAFCTGWVCDAVIDTFLLRLTDTYTHTLGADCCVTAALKRGCSSSNLWSGIELLSKSVIFLPCNLRRSHWTPFVVDLRGHSILYLNPINTSPATLEIEMISLIVELVRDKFAIPSVLFDWKIIPRTLQKDSMNCGIFVMWYAWQIAQEKPLTDSLNPNTFRREIFKVITGQCMQRVTYDDEKCKVCKNRKNLKDWIECDQCSQWFHCKCAAVTLSDSKKVGFRFVCP